LIASAARRLRELLAACSAPTCKCPYKCYTSVHTSVHTSVTQVSIQVTIQVLHKCPYK
jgi:hypothetical protein